MLEQRIEDSLRLFGLQGIPLTLFELHKFLVGDVDQLRSNIAEDGELTSPAPPGVVVSFETLVNVLSEMQAGGKVVERLGFFALKGNEAAIFSRWRGYAHGIYRERRIRRWMRGLSYIPFVQAVGITGSQALGLEKPGSDIDLFIVTKKSWMWTARTLVTFYFQLLGIRRHSQYIAGRMCLNHYVAGTKSFTTGRNIYTALEYAKIRPVFGGSLFRELQKKNSLWIQTFFPNFRPVHEAVEQAPLFQRLSERVFRLGFGQWLEQFLKQSQQRRIQTSIKFIVVEEDELSFHPNSKQEGLVREFFKA